jgi:phosphoglycolate phosphatase
LGTYRVSTAPPNATICPTIFHSSMIFQNMHNGTVSDYKAIIWDWNGTLLDDTHLAVAAMNGMLARRGMPVLTVDRYKSLFTFPVKEYYREVGFDFDLEPFEVPAMEFIDRYNREVWDCTLQADALRVLNHFREVGMGQYILSAMQQDTLDQCLDYYRIGHFFGHASGLDDHYAHSKLETGQELLAKLPYETGELLLIGDTIHDFEVATELGCACLLVSNGHQSHERLVGTGARVIGNLSQLIS